MNPSFEQELIDVWRQVLVENADVVVLGAERYPVQKTPRVVCGRWTLCSTEARFGVLSRTRKRNLDRLKWHAPARR
jgi:hypothetical protein